MAKMKASYRVDEKNKAIILNKDVPLTKNEELIVKSLEAQGYKLSLKSVARAQAKAKDKNLKKGKEFYKSVLSIKEFETFVEMSKGGHFFNARAWANKLLEEKAKAEAEEKKKKEEAKTKADTTKAK